MTIESLPSPYELRGGGNPYYTANSNIAGLSDGPNSLRLDLPGDYDRYMQDASPFLAGLDGSDSFIPNWPLVLSTMTYGFVRQGGLLGVAIGLLGGIFLPRTTVVLYALDATRGKWMGDPMLRRA